MAQLTFSNPCDSAHKDTDGASIVFLDACLIKVGKPVVPIHCLNTGKSKDEIKGSMTVKSDGRMPTIKMCYFDMKFEKKSVCRLGGPLFRNKKNVVE